MTKVDPKITAMLQAAKAAAAPLVTVQAQPEAVLSLAEEWMRLEARLADGSNSEDDAIMAQQGAAMEALIETPAGSIAGLHAKLRVMVTWMGIIPTAKDHTYDESMLLSMLADAERLSGEA